MRSPERQTETGDEAAEFGAMAGRSVDHLQRYVAVVLRHRTLILKTVGIVFALGVLFLLQSVSRYTSTAALLIDAKQVGMSATSTLEGTLAFDTGAVDSQVLVLQSDRIAGAVADRLNLASNPAFVRPPSSVIGGVASFLRGAVFKTLRALGADLPATEFEEMPADIKRILLAEQLTSNLKVTRNARTYVLTIEYTDPDPSLARTIAAAYASTYLEDQLGSRFETARRASTWLAERVREVKQRAAEADAAAQAFRTANKLTEASGRLISEQALTDSNTQLSVARNELNTARAKYERLQQIINSKEYAASSVDALANPIISSMRVKYLDALKTNSDISARLGPQHEAAVRARKEMGEFEKLIFAELSRLLQTYQSEVQIIADRVAAIEQSIEAMRKTSDVDTAAMAKLKALEHEAATYNNLYAAYLQKAQDLLQQQSIPISDARIIGDASLPIQPSRPRKLLVLLGALILGLMAGGGLAFLREMRERSFRTAAQVREELGLDFVAHIPLLPPEAFAQREGEAATSVPAPDAPRRFRAASPGLEMVLNDPMSRYAEAMRAVKLSTDYYFNARRPLVIGFVSMIPNEGKSTAAKNFASLVASQGERVLLIDGDLRNPQLTRALTPSARGGLLEALHGGELRIDQSFWLEERSGLAFLPGSARGRVPIAGDILASPAMIDLIKRLQSTFGVIVIDLPPLGAVLDAVAAASFVDGYHLIVEWGGTARSAVHDILASEPVITARTIGVSLSKVDIDQLGAFDAHASYGYTGNYLGRYYEHGEGATRAQPATHGRKPTSARAQGWLASIARHGSAGARKLEKHLSDLKKRKIG